MTQWLQNLLRVLPALQGWWQRRQAGTPATSEEVREENRRQVETNRDDISDLIDEKFD